MAKATVKLEERTLAHLKNGHKRKGVARWMGTTVKYVARIAAQHCIGVNGKSVTNSKESPSYRGPYSRAAFKLGHPDIDVVTLEFARLVGLYRVGDVADCELQEAAAALGVSFEAIKTMWQFHWRPDAAAIVKSDEANERQIKKTTSTYLLKVTPLNDENRAWFEIGEDNETETPALDDVRNRITKEILELAPRQPVDPSKRLIEFAVQVIGVAMENDARGTAVMQSSGYAA